MFCIFFSVIDWVDIVVDTLTGSSTSFKKGTIQQILFAVYSIKNFQNKVYSIKNEALKLLGRLCFILFFCLQALSRKLNRVLSSHF